MGYVISKIRSLGQIIEKLCVWSKGHIFSLILMKLGIFFYEILYEFETGSCGVINLVTRSNLRKKNCVCLTGLNFHLILMELGQNVCLNEILDEFESGSSQLKT